MPVQIFSKQEGGHLPVLLKETLQYLNAEKSGKYVDGTVGNGGHTTEILKANQKSRVLGIDLDQTSLNKLQTKLIEQGLDQKCKLVSGSYKDLEKISQKENFFPVVGLLLDLGFSSMQMDDPARGFSFQSEGPLDMRFDPHQELTAGAVVNRYPKERLENVFKSFGEEKFSRRIADKIIERRKTSPVKTTLELFDLIKLALPKPVQYRAADSARRIFQALRIEVNSELENLKAVLPQAIELLAPGGRLVIISFHSLEDRIVKQYFAKEASTCVCPPDFPTCVCGKTTDIRILTRKPVTATVEEVEANSRSKSAKLRAIEKI
jgi:16S rRNA (cytosine1402-N4)-methyltransferase